MHIEAFQRNTWTEERLPTTRSLRASWTMKRSDHPEI